MRGCFGEVALAFGLFKPLIVYALEIVTDGLPLLCIFRQLAVNDCLVRTGCVRFVVPMAGCVIGKVPIDEHEHDDRYLAALLTR